MTSPRGQWRLEARRLGGEKNKLKMVRALSNNYSLLTSARVIVSPVKMTVNFTEEKTAAAAMGRSPSLIALSHRTILASCHRGAVVVLLDGWRTVLIQGATPVCP